MSYYDEIVEKINQLIEESSVHNMNEMLMQLSHDQQINQEQRFEQQQRLREAIFTHHDK
ncbi:TPA: DUF2526 family protein [Providencia rettgeri]|uniref:DUF2526 family protein n=1 Tax=unclassified Providencia TaxID=2633465 RepID=UPI00234A6377|nr:MULTISPECIES: DUF2526 family protein [unclassified Providencia]HEP0305416.1 DUF2526 family protein [Providencia rettgeri]